MAKTTIYVDLETASKNLNMSIAAIRKGLQRGNFSGKKNAKGAWVLQLTPKIMAMSRQQIGQQLSQEKKIDNEEETSIHSTVAILERENARLQLTITRLLDQQDSLIKQTENEQILRRESQEQVLKLTNQLSHLSNRNVTLLEDNSQLGKEQTMLKRAVVQLLTYVKKNKDK